MKLKSIKWKKEPLPFELYRHLCKPSLKCISTKGWNWQFIYYNK